LCTLKAANFYWSKTDVSCNASWGTFPLENSTCLPIS
jgi:hypothetical protein